MSCHVKMWPQTSARTCCIENSLLFFTLPARPSLILCSSVESSAAGQEVARDKSGNIRIVHTKGLCLLLTTMQRKQSANNIPLDINGHFPEVNETGSAHATRPLKVAIQTSPHRVRSVPIWKMKFTQIIGLQIEFH